LYTPLYNRQGLHKVCKNLAAISKFEAAGVRQEPRSTPRPQKYSY